MSRLRLLILDANIIIHLQRAEIWSQFLDRCEVIVSRTVLDEAHFYEDDHGQRLQIDLNPDIQSGKVTVIDVTPANVKQFRDRFDPLYFQSLDDGEAESLAFLVAATPEHRICSADKIVFKVLSHLGMDDRGVSLEEILAVVGLGRALPWAYTKKYREEYSRKGQQDLMMGIGLKKPAPGKSRK